MTGRKPWLMLCCYSVLLGFNTSSVAIAAVPTEVRELPGGRVGTSYNLILPARGGISPYRWAVLSSELPPGLTLSENGELAGTFEQPGAFNFTVQAEDSMGERDSRQIKIVVEPRLAVVPPNDIVPLKIMTSALPPAIEQGSYSLTLSAQGGVVPYEWSIEGLLPKGFELIKDLGEIRGKSEKSGNWKLRVRVTDSKSTPATQEKDLDLVVLTASVEKAHETPWYQRWWIVVLATIGIILLILTLLAYYANIQCPNPDHTGGPRNKTKSIGQGRRRCSVCGVEFWNTREYAAPSRP